MVHTKGRVSLLRKGEFFSLLPDSTLKSLLPFIEEISLPPNTYIFKSGDPSFCLYMLVEGSVSIIREKQDTGEEEEIAQYVEGDSFGELDLLTGSPRTASAKTLSTVILLRFPKDDQGLFHFLSSHPKIGARILQSFLVVVAGRIRKANNLLKENSPWIQEIRKQVYGDKLTGLYNRTFLEEHLPSLLKDPKVPVSLFMIKPDNFKQINDTYGHEAGDQSLVRMASTLKTLLPTQALIFRYMGNELGCILPHTDIPEAQTLALSIQKAYNSLDISDLTQGNPFTITVSIGIAVYPHHGMEASALIEAAHALPLKGREAGGNKILFPS
ncbi:MAG: GGDEF domain-containing protein [Spirochaetales bacterium]